MVSLRTFIRRIYLYLLGRKTFFRLHQHLYFVGLNGMGFLNWEDFSQSGEAYLAKKICKLKKNLKVLDVGAHHGEYSQMIRNLSKTAEIIAFEPHPQSFKILAEGATTYDIKICNLALGSDAGTATLYDQTGEENGSLLATFHEEVLSKIYCKSSAGQAVHVDTVDNWMKKNNIEHIDLLKVDTEGHELEVLQGAKKSIEEGVIDLIQFEFNSSAVIRGVFITDVMSLLENFEFYRLLPRGFYPVKKQNRENYEIQTFQNIVAVRQGSEFAVIFSNA